MNSVSGKCVLGSEWYSEVVSESVSCILAARRYRVT